MNTESLPNAITILISALNEDKSEGSYYYSWQANIAMAFKDEYERFNPHMKDGNKEIIHRIANNAAKNFLDMLCIQPSQSIEQPPTAHTEELSTPPVRDGNAKTVGIEYVDGQIQHKQEGEAKYTWQD